MSNDSAGKRIVLKETIPLAVPICVYIDITNKCNFTCPWCPTGNNLKKELGTMDLFLFKKIINDLKKITKKHNKKIKVLCMFFLGESFLHKDFSKMLKIAKKARVAEKISVSTNGSLLNHDNRLKIIESGVDIISISMYGISNEDYKKVSSVYTFDQILQNSKDLIKSRGSKNKPKVNFKYFYRTKKVEQKIEYLLKFCDHISFEEPFNWNKTYSNRSRNFITHKNPRPVKYCSQPWYVLSITWNGYALPCCADWAWFGKIGDATRNSIEEIWNGKELLKFRKRIVEGKQNNNEACNGCNFAETCDEASNIDELIEKNQKKALASYL